MKESNAWILIVAMCCVTIALTTLVYYHDTEITARMCIQKVAVGQGVTKCADDH